MAANALIHGTTYTMNRHSYPPSQPMCPVTRRNGDPTLWGRKLIPASITPTGTSSTVFHPLTARLAAVSNSGMPIARGRVASSNFGRYGNR